MKYKILFYLTIRPDRLSLINYLIVRLNNKFEA